MIVTAEQKQMINVSLTRETIIQIAKTAIITSFDKGLSPERYYSIKENNLCVRKRISAHNRDLYEYHALRVASDTDKIMVSALTALNNYEG